MKYEYESQLEKLKENESKDEVITELWTKASQIETIDKDKAQELRREAMKRYRELKNKYISEK